MKSKIMAITVALALVLSLLFAVAAPVSAAPTTWNATGTWVFNYGEGNSFGSPYDLTLTQAGTALSGSAGYPAGTPPPYQYTFVLTSGSVNANAISWTATYASPINADAVGCTLHVTGTIAADGTMSGTWTDNYPSSSGSRSGIWKTTTGQAVQVATAIVFGTDAAPTLAFSAPSPVTLNNGNGMMMAGWNVATGGAGSVALTQGTSNTATWTVTAAGASNMVNGSSTPLQNYLLLGNSNGSGASWYIANGSATQYWVPTVINAGSSDTAVYSAAGPLTYSGQTLSASIPFYAAQYVTPTDALGVYSDTITFTASCIP